MAKIIGKPSADDVKRVAVAALVAALDDSKEHARKNPRMTGMRAVATGAVLYTAGKAAFSGRRFISERLQSDEQEPEDEAYEDEDEEREEEPVAEEDEDFDEDEEDLDEEEDEDFEERSAADEPPVHPDDEDVDEDDLPARPSKKRQPVGRF
jgi:hypothetical protein